MLNLKSFFSKESEGTQDSWYYAALEECADGHWDWNASKNEVYISRKLKELIGYTEEETKHNNFRWWLEKIHPDDQAEIKRKFEELTSSKSGFTYFDDFRFLCKNGDYIWLENQAKILRDDEGRLIRITGMTLNITPQKYIHNQLYTIILDQEKIDQNRMRFLSNLSHEFRSPLSGIIGMTTLLSETILTSDQRHFTDNIVNSTEMLLSLVNDILDVTKLNSGKFQFEHIPFSPFQVIRSASDLIRPNIIKKNVSFKISIANDIPEFVMGDPTRLQQVLVNLLTNAAKFTSKGTITLQVRKKLSDEKTESLMAENLYFEIIDTGIGIAPEILENLFQDFTQANNSINRIYGGTGLGLAICKELVHLMGGKIGVKSSPDLGSTFWFTIPLEEKEATASENLGISHSHSPAPQQKLNILLVEDNKVNQEVMQGFLSLLGDEVTVANNGQEAVEIFPLQKFDLVLMDLNMPILDGFQATEALRKLPNGTIPIIAVTANTFIGEHESCLQQGITQVLTKPITKISLEMALLPHRPVPNLQSNNASYSSHSLLSKLTEPLTPAIVDLKILETLITDLGKERVLKLLDIYRKDALVLVSQLKKCTPDDSKNYAHTLAGMSENLGIVLMGQTARKIMNTRQEKFQNLPILVQDLERNFEVTLTELHKLYDL